jgi:hypothetical protein
MLGSHVQDVKLAIFLFTIGVCFQKVVNVTSRSCFVLQTADFDFPISVAKTKCCDPDENRLS